MNKIIILIVLVSKLLSQRKCDINMNFFQHDYHLVPEWFEVISYNKKYVKAMVATTFKRNRTCVGLNMTHNYKLDLENNLDLVAQVYRFASNEYREFPLRMQFNFCKSMEQDFAGLGNMQKCGNFTPCHIHKGRTYHTCNWTPDESKFPPLIPSGRYMTEFQGLYNSTELFLWRAYTAISRPEV